MGMSIDIDLLEECLMSPITPRDIHTLCPNIPLLGMYSSEMRTRVSQKPHNLMFTAELCALSPN